MGLTVGNTQDNFNYKVVRQFALVTVLWGHCRYVGWGDFGCTADLA